MKVQVRCGVFETNSSSMHSLAIYNGYSEQDMYYTQDEINKEMKEFINDKGVFNSKYHSVFYNKGQDDWYFGRYPLYILTSFAEKFAYVYSSIVSRESYKCSDITTIFEEILKESCPLIKDIHWPTDIGTDDYNGFLPNFNEYDIPQFKKDVKEFCSNKSKWVITEGDESCLFIELMATGIFKKEKLTKPDGSVYFDEECQEIADAMD